MIAIIEKLFSRDSPCNQSHVTLGRFPTLQSYLVRLRTEIAIILSPYNNCHCNHIAVISGRNHK